MVSSSKQYQEVLSVNDDALCNMVSTSKQYEAAS